MTRDVSTTSVRSNFSICCFFSFGGAFCRVLRPVCHIVVVKGIEIRVCHIRQSFSVVSEFIRAVHKDFRVLGPSRGG